MLNNVFKLFFPSVHIKFQNHASECWYGYFIMFTVCVCAVCALVWTDIWGQFCDFNRISADTRGVGTSAVVRPMPINVLSIFKHIYIVNVIS